MRRMLLFRKHTLHTLDVFHGVSQSVHFGHFLLFSRTRDVTPKHFETRVHLFHPITFTLVSAGHFLRHCGRDGVAVDGMEGDFSPTR